MTSNPITPYNELVNAIGTIPDTELLQKLIQLLQDDFPVDGIQELVEETCNIAVFYHDRNNYDSPPADRDEYFQIKFHERLEELRKQNTATKRYRLVPVEDESDDE